MRDFTVFESINFLGDDNNERVSFPFSFFFFNFYSWEDRRNCSNRKTPQWGGPKSAVHCVVGEPFSVTTCGTAGFAVNATSSHGFIGKRKTLAAGPARGEKARALRLPASRGEARCPEGVCPGVWAWGCCSLLFVLIGQKRGRSLVRGAVTRLLRNQ